MGVGTSYMSIGGYIVGFDNLFNEEYIYREVGIDVQLLAVNLIEKIVAVTPSR